MNLKDVYVIRVEMNLSRITLFKLSLKSTLKLNLKFFY